MTTHHRVSASVLASRSIRCAAIMLGASLVASSPVNAQYRPYLGTFTYSTALPASYTKDFVDTFSWFGFTLEGDWFFSQKTSLGFAFGWQEIYEETGDSYNFDGGTFTGRTYRHLGIFPLLMRGRYWLGQEGTGFRPFVGAGLGTYRVRQTLDFGIFTSDETHWHFGVAPEAGVMFLTSRGLAWLFNARYNYPFKAGDYINGDKASWSYWGFSIGVGLAP